MKRLLWLWIFGMVGTSWASSSLDHQFNLKTVGFIKSWNNVDGILDEILTSAYHSYFTRKSRFTLHDLSQADAVLSRSKLPYGQILSDMDILKQVARSTRTETILKTKITKSGRDYQFTLDWLHAPLMEVLGTQQFTLSEPEEGVAFTSSDVTRMIHAQLDLLMAQVPFVGSVTGKDQDTVTLDLGFGSGLKVGDQIAVGTIDEVKRHPILNTVVDWQLSQTGRVIVEQTDEGMAFGRISTTVSGQEIVRQQKVLRVIASSLPVTSPYEQGNEKTDENQDEDEEETPPKLGRFGITGLVGTYSRAFTNPSVDVANSGSGFVFGGQADVELWLTRKWFGNLELGNSFWNYTQKDVSTAVLSPASASGGVSGAMTHFKFNAGYSHAFTGDFLGPKGWLKLGYKSNSYTLPISTVEYTDSTSVSSIFFGIGGEVPLRSGWGGFVDLNFKLLSWVKQTLSTLDPSSVSDMEFLLGGTYRLNSRLTVRAGVQLLMTGAEFAVGQSFSQKNLTFQPSLLYYF